MITDANIAELRDLANRTSAIAAVAAHGKLPFLLDEIERLRAENERLRGASAETTAPSNNPYKPGDIVVFYGPPELRADPHKRLYEFGARARVKWANSMDVCAVFLSDALRSSPFAMPPNMFTPEKFKPGDRVRIVALCGNASPRLLGAEATVSNGNHLSGLIVVKVSSFFPNHYWAYSWELELIERAPVKPALARHPLPTTSVVSHEQSVRDTQAPLLIDECEEQRGMATMAAKEGGE